LSSIALSLQKTSQKAGSREQFLSLHMSFRQWESEAKIKILSPCLKERISSRVLQFKRHHSLSFSQQTI